MRSSGCCPPNSWRNTAGSDPDVTVVFAGRSAYARGRRLLPARVRGVKRQSRPASIQMRAGIVHVLHLPPHPVADAQQYEQEQRHGQFGRRYREPDPRDARQPRQHEEAESHQHDAPKHGEPRRKPSALDALVIADRDDVDSEKGYPAAKSGRPRTAIA